MAVLPTPGQVDGVLFKRLALLLGIRVVHGLTAAHIFDGLLDGAARRPGGMHQPAELAPVLQGRENEELGRDIGVVALLGELVGDVQQPRQIVRDLDVAGRALHPRQAVERLAEGRAQLVDVDVGLCQQVAHRAAFLVEQRRHQVHRLDELVIAPDRQALGVLERQLELAGQFVHSHGIRFPRFFTFRKIGFPRANSTVHEHYSACCGTQRKGPRARASRVAVK